MYQYHEPYTVVYPTKILFTTHRNSKKTTLEEELTTLSRKKRELKKKWLDRYQKRVKNCTRHKHTFVHDEL